MHPESPLAAMIAAESLHEYEIQHARELVRDEIRGDSRQVVHTGESAPYTAVVIARNESEAWAMLNDAGRHSANRHGVTIREVPALPA